MPRAPRISGAQIIKRLLRIGYIQVRTTGSHVRLKHPTLSPTTIPLHDVVGPGLLRKIMRDTGLSSKDIFNVRF